MPEKFESKPELGAQPEFDEKKIEEQLWPGEKFEGIKGLRKVTKVEGGYLIATNRPGDRVWIEAPDPDVNKFYDLHPFTVDAGTFKEGDEALLINVSHPSEHEKTLREKLLDPRKLSKEE